MKVEYDLVVRSGTYQDRSGEEKARWISVGKLFIGDDGRRSIKIDCVPVVPDWEGWISCFEPRPRDGAAAPAPPPRPAPAPPPRARDTFDDDVPF